MLHMAGRLVRTASSASSACSAELASLGEQPVPIGLGDTLTSIYLCSRLEQQAPDAHGSAPYTCSVARSAEHLLQATGRYGVGVAGRERPVGNGRADSSSKGEVQLRGSGSTASSLRQARGDPSLQSPLHSAARSAR